MSQALSSKLIFTSPQMFLAFGFGSGLSRFMPGTMGTIVSIPLYLAMLPLAPWAYVAVLVLTSLVGIYLCGYATKVLGVHDHSGIVWDEFVGFWVTMFLVPFSWQNLLLGFILFRFFDMVKPWPISLVDKHVHGGFGIMADDVLAGVAACASLHALLLFL